MHIKITDSNGKENIILGSIGFCQKAYPADQGYTYEAIVDEPLSDEQIARLAITDAKDWRDMQLEGTDKASQTPDWPNRDNILLYRTALRDWPSTADFPDKKPTLST
jgi:hypothetical protein